jgi:hypothetical protein
MGLAKRKKFFSLFHCQPTFGGRGNLLAFLSLRGFPYGKPWQFR